MKRLWIILIAALVLGLLFVYCVSHHTTEIQNDVALRTAEALRGHGLGFVSLSADGRDLTLTGVAPDQAARARAASVARETTGVRSIDNQLTVNADAVDNAARAARRRMMTTVGALDTALTMNEDGVFLSGRVPDQAAREAFLEKLGTVVRADGISDSLEVANLAGEEWSSVWMSVAAALAGLSEANVETVNKKVYFNGIARSPEAAQQARSVVLRAMPAGYNAAFDFKVSGASCQQQLNQALVAQKVRFESGSAAISVSSYPMLDGIAAIAKRCGGAKIEVGGHTDATGDEEMNRQLSQNRAAAVAEYLRSKGVDGDRLSAVGYGEDRPLVSNITPEGRAKNRRIEVTVRGDR